MAEEQTTGTAGDGTATEAGDAKVTFTPDQQAKLDTLIDGAYTKAYDKADKKYQTKIDELNTKLESLKPKEPDDGKKGKVSDEDWQAKLEAVQKDSNDKIEKQQKVNQAVQNKIIRADIISAAASADCTEPGDLAEIMISSGQIAFDEDGEIVITPASGILKLGDDGNPISLEQYVKRFIALKPMWQKANVGKGGSGSGGGGSQPGKKKLLEMTHQEVLDLPSDEYEKMHAEQFPQTKGWLE